ncbi:MAG: SAM-dependent methyltransferase [Clostridiales bacterium]|nr:SAM-dependent methyltransferase [Candidatus Cacconaster stercorequi]
MEQKLLQLQPRLQLLADLIPVGSHLADIGTDHGYLPVWLRQHGKITTAIASDVGEEPLQHARRTAEEYQVDGIDFRLCDGLNGIEAQEADTVVIAGMGGETIIHILSDVSWTKDGCLLLLQPMTKPELLRVWLTENGYRINCEHLVRDKDYLYPIFKVYGGQQQLTLAEEYGGVGLDCDPLYETYLEQRIGRLTHAIDGLKRGNREQNRAKIGRLEEICNALKEKKGAL